MARSALVLLVATIRFQMPFQTSSCPSIAAPTDIFRQELEEHLTVFLPDVCLKQVKDQGSVQIQELVKSLNLQPHIEGGFFAETDRARDLVPSPFPSQASSTSSLAPQRPGFNPALRNSSTTIFYLLTPQGPQGGFHRNQARTVHTLHRGRGRYVIIHADDEPGRRIETFVVGPNVAQGERLQWIVEGGKFKASFLLPDEEGGLESQGLLISEVVVPGFEYCDHDFLTERGLLELVGTEKASELKWLLSPLAAET